MTRRAEAMFDGEADEKRKNELFITDSFSWLRHR
jgi:hypothetical protein